MKKVKCPRCHGKGKTTCSDCKGKGVLTCYVCHGSGHACPVCRNSPGKVKDQYGDWVYCPNCHGDYANQKYECPRCGGVGKLSCSKTETCSLCHGTGEVDKVSKLSLGLFRAFSMAFGFSGLQYLYVGRWLLFALQFTTFSALVATVIFLEPVLSFVSQFGIDRECLKMVQNILGACVLLNMVLGMVVIKCDKQGGLLNDEYKRGWYWLFLLLFGWIGAHLAYVSRRVRDLLWCYLYCIVISPIVVHTIVTVVKECMTKNMDKGDILVRLMIYGIMFIVFIGIGTKVGRWLMGRQSD